MQMRVPGDLVAWLVCIEWGWSGSSFACWINMGLCPMVRRGFREQSGVQGLMEAGLCEPHWHPGCSLEVVPQQVFLHFHSAVPATVWTPHSKRQVALVAFGGQGEDGGGGCRNYIFWLLKQKCSSLVTLCQHSRKLFLEEVVCSLTDLSQPLLSQCSVTRPFTNFSCFCRFRFDIVLPPLAF